MNHYLKIQKEYLENLILGKKKFEIRKNDRDYQVDDILVFDKKPDCMEIDNYEFRITHVYSGAFIDPLYVILSLEPISNLGNENTKGTTR